MGKVYDIKCVPGEKSGTVQPVPSTPMLPDYGFEPGMLLERHCISMDSLFATTQHKLGIVFDQFLLVVSEPYLVKALLVSSDHPHENQWVQDTVNLTLNRTEMIRLTGYTGVLATYQKIVAGERVGAPTQLGSLAILY